MHLRKCSKWPNSFKKKKIEGVFMIIFANCNQEKFQNSRKALKNFFDNAFKIIFRKIYTQRKISKWYQRKFRPFASRKVGKLYPRCSRLRRNLYQEQYCHESQESYVLVHGVHTGSSVKKTNADDSRTNNAISYSKNSVDSTNSKSG